MKLYEESVSKIPPLGIRILFHLEKSKINRNLTDNVSSLDIAPWILSAPTVRFDLTKFKKDKLTLKPTVLSTTYHGITFVRNKFHMYC